MLRPPLQNARMIAIASSRAATDSGLLVTSEEHQVHAAILTRCGLPYQGLYGLAKPSKPTSATDVPHR